MLRSFGVLIALAAVLDVALVSIISYGISDSSRSNTV
jgi:hypothetical protein